MSGLTGLNNSISSPISLRFPLKGPKNCTSSEIVKCDLNSNSLVFETIIKSCGSDPKKYPVVYGAATPMDQFGLYGDSSLISNELGWEPKIKLSQRIEEFVKWSLKNNRWLLEN